MKNCRCHLLRRSHCSVTIRCRCMFETVIYVADLPVALFAMWMHQWLLQTGWYVVSSVLDSALYLYWSTYLITFYLSWAVPPMYVTWINLDLTSHIRGL